MCSSLWYTFLCSNIIFLSSLPFIFPSSWLSRYSSIWKFLIKHYPYTAVCVFCSIISKIVWEWYTRAWTDLTDLVYWLPNQDNHYKHIIWFTAHCHNRFIQILLVWLHFSWTTFINFYVCFPICMPCNDWSKSNTTSFALYWTSITFWVPMSCKNKSIYSPSLYNWTLCFTAYYCGSFVPLT